MMNKKSFTLIEMVITLVLISILSVGISYIFLEGFRIYSTSRNYISLRGDVRAALRRIVLEARQADSGSLASSSDITLVTDIDNDGVNESVRFYLDGTDLKRQEDGFPAGGDILCGNVQSVSFTPTNINAFTTNLSAAKQGEAITLQTNVRARNI